MCNTITINTINNHCGYFRGNAHRHFGNGSNCKFCTVLYYSFCGGLTTIEAIDEKYDEIMKIQNIKEQSLIDSESMYPDECNSTQEYNFEDEDLCFSVEDARIKFEDTLESAYNAIEDKIRPERFYPNIDSFRRHLIEQIETEAKFRFYKRSLLKFAKKKKTSSNHPHRDIARKMINGEIMNMFMEGLKISSTPCKYF
jgi:hypothetical protein